LCAAHHQQSHEIGVRSFEKLYGVDLQELARQFAAKSPDLGMREAMKEAGIYV